MDTEFTTNKDPLIGSYRIRRLTLPQRILKDSLEVLSVGQVMQALVEFDVTEARTRIRSLRREGRSISLTAFLVKSIAQALDENRKLNALLGGRRIIEFDEVDVSLPVEGASAEGKTPQQLVVRNAARKTIDQISAEIERARSDASDAKALNADERRNMALMRFFFLFPRFIRKALLRILIGNPFMVKKMSGTTFLTTVSMFTKLPGYLLAPLGGPRTVAFIIGSVVEKPGLVSGRPVQRQYQSMTVVINHIVIDGAPAARFLGRLQKIIEKAEVLAPSGG